MLCKFTLATLLLLGGLHAHADTLPSVDCAGCTTLREFGNYGAASLYQVVGVGGPAVGSDRIWVRNPVTGRSVFVDIDTPVTMTAVYGFAIPVPDLTRQEVNATWANGSASMSYLLPVEVIDAIGDALETEFLEHREDAPGTPDTEVPADEFDNLPGFNDLPWQYFNFPFVPFSLSNGGWSFSVQLSSGSPVPVVEVVECAWHSGC
jgi:hypothetical protein